MENILRRFPIGRVTEVRRASSGLMHGTWLVEAEGGKFVLQRLHHKLATPEILSDFKAVTEHLAARGVLRQRRAAPARCRCDEGMVRVPELESEHPGPDRAVPGRVSRRCAGSALSTT